MFTYRTVLSYMMFSNILVFVLVIKDNFFSPTATSHKLSSVLTELEGLKFSQKAYTSK